LVRALNDVHVTLRVLHDESRVAAGEESLHHTHAAAPHNDCVDLELLRLRKDDVSNRLRAVLRCGLGDHLALDFVVKTLLREKKKIREK
jgi:hypothetical protein